MSIIQLARPGPEQDPSRDATSSAPVAGRRDADAMSRDLLASVASREPLAPYDEAELGRGLAAGDPTALTAIAHWLWEPLASYAYRLLGDRDAAMDVAQDACLRLWDHRGRDAPRRIRPWMFRTARNLALDRVKTGRTRRGLLNRYPHGRPPERPDEVLQRQRVATEVQRAIQALPERRREVFALAYLQGLGYAEIAEVLGISPKTVQNHMSFALAQLRAELRGLLEERRDDRPFHMQPGADRRERALDRLE